MAKAPAAVSGSKGTEYKIVQGPFNGYRAREDITMLPPGILVRGSHDVLTNTAQRVGIRKGYSLYGQAASGANEPILSAYDWTKIANNDRHVRSHGTVLEFPFSVTTGMTTTTTWENLASGFANANFNYTTFFDPVELTTLMLFVNGTSNIYEWSGGITTYASATATTLTKQGTTTWAEEGFYTQGNINATTISFVNSNPDTILDSGNGFVTAGFRAGQQIRVSGAVNAGNNGVKSIASVTDGVITLSATDTLTAEGAGASITINAIRQVQLNGVTYTYTGGESTTTLTGVSPAPVGVVGDVISQTIRTIPNSLCTSLPANFKNDLIGNLAEQIFIGSLSSYYVYISYLSNYLDYSFSLPREPGQGAKKTLGGYARGFMNQEADMYISAGADLWYKTLYTQTTTTTTVGGVAVNSIFEQINLEQLKTKPLQAAQSQAVISKIDNNILYLSNEPIINSLGRVNNVVLTPQITDISYPIVQDMNQYDFENAAIFYYRQFIYVSIPTQGIMLVYNMTNPANQYWEAPQSIPVSRFSVIDGELYGHSAGVAETYKLFDGYNDNGFEIYAAARFSFRNYGARYATKNITAFYVEGYINPSTTLTLGVQYDIDGCATDTNFTLSGGDRRFVCIPSDDNSFGKFPFGKQPFGGNINLSSTDDLPPKFRWIKTFPPIPFYEEQTYFESFGIDQQWELVAFGGNTYETSEGNNARMD